MRAPNRFVLSGSSVIRLLVFLLTSGCGGSYDETIAGVAVPVPKAMTRSSDKPAEMSLLGFAAGHATFHGRRTTAEIVEFYKTEMPARGWQPNMNLRSGGAMLAYSKDGKTLLVAVGRQQDQATLTLTIGAGR